MRTSAFDKLRCSLAATLAFVLSSVWQLSFHPHHDRERHSICPEHGELIHVARRPMFDAPVREGVRALGLAESGAHDHCPYAHRTCDATDSARSLVVVNTVPETLRRPADAPRDVAALHRLATKQSPPSNDA